VWRFIAEKATSHAVFFIFFLVFSAYLHVLKMNQINAQVHGTTTMASHAMVWDDALKEVLEKDRVDPLDIELFVQGPTPRALVSACHLEYLQVARLIANLLTQIDEDGRQYIINAFQTVCSNGHLDLAVLFRERFNPTTAEVRLYDNYALRCACIDNHPKVALWLITTFDLTLDDVSCNDSVALTHACGDGHLEVVQMLLQLMNSDNNRIAAADRITAANHRALAVATNEKIIDVLYQVYVELNVQPVSGDALDNYNEAKQRDIRSYIKAAESS
jgi:hypothetical protein